MTQLLLGGVLALIIWALWSKQPGLRAIARIFTALMTLTSATGAMFLFWVGQKAHWTSDGPGMLLIMVGILGCGLFAFVFGGLFVSSFNQSSSSEGTGLHPPLNP